MRTFTLPSPRPAATFAMVDLTLAISSPIDPVVSRMNATSIVRAPVSERAVGKRRLTRSSAASSGTSRVTVAPSQSAVAVSASPASDSARGKSSARPLGPVVSVTVRSRASLTRTLHPGTALPSSSRTTRKRRCETSTRANGPDSFASHLVNSW